jgi:predicted DNA repair protein MutK
VTSWSLEPRSTAVRSLAGAACIGAALVVVMLQELGVRLRREEHRAWWAETGRDLLNAAGFVMLSAALRIFGYPPPAAILVGGTLTLVFFGAYVLMATQAVSAQPRTWALVAGLGALAPALAWPAELVAAIGEIAASLFPLGG